MARPRKSKNTQDSTSSSSSRPSHLIEALETEERAIDDRLEALNDEIAKLERARKGLRAAIAALSGREPPGESGAETRRGRRPGRRNARSSKGTGVTIGEVTSWINELLQSENSMTSAQLRERITERARAAGRTRQGLHLVVARALKRGGFGGSNGNYRLS